MEHKVLTPLGWLGKDKFVSDEDEATRFSAKEAREWASIFHDVQGRAMVVTDGAIAAIVEAERQAKRRIAGRPSSHNPYETIEVMRTPDGTYLARSGLGWYIFSDLSDLQAGLDELYIMDGTFSLYFRYY